MTTFTMPAPACPSTSIAASCSCTLRTFSCICCACFISPASCPLFIMVSRPLLRGFHRFDRRVEVGDQLAHERVAADLRARLRRTHAPLAFGQRGRRPAVHRGHPDGHADRTPE